MKLAAIDKILDKMEKDDISFCIPDLIQAMECAVNLSSLDVESEYKEKSPEERCKILFYSYADHLERMGFKTPLNTAYISFANTLVDHYLPKNNLYETWRTVLCDIKKQEGLEYHFFIRTE